jgi:hypothetical protein
MSLDPFSLAGAALSLFGGDDNESTKTQEIDPKLSRYVYGEDGKSGLLAQVDTRYNDQLARGGLNDTQRAGLEMRRQVYTDPRWVQSYDGLRSMGMNLLGQGIAANPYTQGQQAGPQPGAAPAPQGLAPMPGQAAQPQPLATVRPTTDMTHSPFAFAQNDAIKAAQTPVQTVAQYQASQAPAPTTAPATSMDELLRQQQQAAYKQYMADELRFAGA